MEKIYYARHTTVDGIDKDDLAPCPSECTKLSHFRLSLAGEEHRILLDRLLAVF